MRRDPISISGRPAAALTIRAAAEATAVSWLKIDSARVSSSTHSAKVPVTDSTGEPGKYNSPFGVAVDIAGEAEAAQKVKGGIQVGDPGEAGHRRQRLVIEDEVAQRFQEPAGTGHHPVPSAVGQAPAEQFEGGPAAGRAVEQGR